MVYIHNAVLHEVGPTHLFRSCCRGGQGDRDPNERLHIARKYRNSCAPHPRELLRGFSAGVLIIHVGCFSCPPTTTSVLHPDMRICPLALDMNRIYNTPEYTLDAAMWLARQWQFDPLKYPTCGEQSIRMHSFAKASSLRTQLTRGQILYRWILRPWNWVSLA